MDRINDDICIFPENLSGIYANNKSEHNVLLWSVLECIANHLELGKVEQQQHFPYGLAVLNWDSKMVLHEQFCCFWKYDFHPAKRL